MGKRAASLTYYLLFAIFPFLVALISILGLWHLPMISLEGEAAAFLPEDVVTLLNLTITHMTEASNGAIFTFGVVFAVWFPFRAVKNMTDEVSDIYGGEKPVHHTLRVLLLSIFILFLIFAFFCYELQNVLAKIAGQRFQFMVSLLWGLCISLFVGSIFMAFF